MRTAWQRSCIDGNGYGSQTINGSRANQLARTWTGLWQLTVWGGNPASR